MRMRRTVAAISTALVAAAASAPAAIAFGGAELTTPRVGVSWNGTAFPRVKCAAYTQGFCRGTITILRAGRVLGRAPLAVRSNDAPSVEVPLGRARGGRRQTLLAGGRAITVLIVVRDLFLNSRTTTARAYLAAG